MNEANTVKRPGLLVSVRDSKEAIAALDGGADVIDVKEPDRGSLGAADSSTIAAVVQAVDGRVPVTAAAGELIDLEATNEFVIPTGVLLFKIGLAGCGAHLNWQRRWQEVAAALSSGNNARPVAVVYADWRTAHAPDPQRVLRAAADFGCPALLVDTWDKSSGSLFDHWPASDLADFIRSAHSHNLIVVLAGSLLAENLPAAAELGPDLLAVRTAACLAGRTSTVSSERVRTLQQAIRAATGRSPLPKIDVGIAPANSVYQVRSSLDSAGQKFS